MLEYRSSLYYSLFFSVYLTYYITDLKEANIMKMQIELSNSHFTHRIVIIKVDHKQLGIWQEWGHSSGKHKVGTEGKLSVMGALERRCLRGSGMGWRQKVHKKVGGSPGINCA